MCLSDKRGKKKNSNKNQDLGRNNDKETQPFNKKKACIEIISMERGVVQILRRLYSPCRELQRRGVGSTVVVEVY